MIIKHKVHKEQYGKDNLLMFILLMAMIPNIIPINRTIYAMI